MNSRSIRSTISIFLVALTLFSIVPISAQDIVPPSERKLPPVHWVRSRDYDMQHVALNLKFDWEKESAYGTATLTLAPFVSNFKRIDLDAGGMVINSVKLGATDLKFEYSEKDTRLSVFLDEAHPAGEPLTIVVDYRTVGSVVSNTLGFGGGGGLKFIKPDAKNPNRRRQIWSQGESDYNRFWFPGYDSPNDFRTSEMIATVEKPMFVVGNGRLLERRDNLDGTETFHWKMDIPYTNYLTSIVVGEYYEVKGQYDGIPVSSYVYPNEVREGTATTKKLPEMVKFFSEITGVRYPYAKYAQTMAEGFSGGMENISATTMTPTMIYDERELLDMDSESLQSHELAHQWFGDYVTTREWSDIWLNESFATYFQAMWHEKSKGRDYFLFNDVRGNQSAYYGAWQQGNRRPIVTKYYDNADALFDTYAYPRGGAVLHMLRKHLGDRLFLKGVSHYLKSNANKPVQTEQLRIAFEEATGQSMDWFFDQWLYRMGHPVFEVTKSYDEGSKKLTMRVKQTVAKDPTSLYPQVELFQTYVDVAVDGKVSRVWIEPKEENVFTFDVPSNPKIVGFDHEGTLIKELKFEKSADELLYQFQNDSDLLGRTWALEQLVRIALKSTEADRSKIEEAVAKGIVNERFAGLRRYAIEQMAPPVQAPGATASYAPAVVSMLKALASDANTSTRAAALQRLGYLRDAQYAPLFTANLDEQSYLVVEAAAVGLGRLKDAKSFAALAKMAETSGWRNRIQVAGLRALSQLEDKRGLAIGMKYAGKGNPTNVRSASGLLLASTGKGDSKVYPLLLENFKEALDGGDLQSVFQGLQNFIILADPRAQEAFDLAKTKFKDQPMLVQYLGNFEGQFKKAIEKK